MPTRWPASTQDPHPGLSRLPLRVMLVDDHDIVRSGLRALFEASGELVVAEAGTCAEAVREAVAAKPQVIVMDVRLGSESGITATRLIREQIPDARVIMLTSFADEEALAAAMLVGASGFILKTVAGDDIVESVRAVAHGKRVFDANLLLAGGFEVMVDHLVPGEEGPDVPPDQGPTTVAGEAREGDTEDDRTNQGG